MRGFGLLMFYIKLISIIVVFAITSAVESAPSVVVTIKPLHSLVAGVMKGVSDPYLLLKRGESAHHLTLKPSQAKEIHNADLLIWVGPAFENFLSKIVKDKALPSLSLMSVEGVQLLPVRGDVHNAEIDGHIWLSPINAIEITRAVVDRLAAIDPINSQIYRENGKRLVRRLMDLDEKLEAQLKPVQDRPYIIYHDALRYFEWRYGLNGGAVAQHSELQLSVKDVVRVKRFIVENGVSCLFYEPSLQPRLLAVLIGESGVKKHMIDPMGIKIKAGVESYFTILESIAQVFERCLVER